MCEQRGLRPGKLEGYLAAIAVAHHSAELEDPTRSEAVRRTMAGIRRHPGVAPPRRRAAAATLSVRTNAYAGSRHDVGAAVGATAVLAAAERPAPLCDACLTFHAADARIFPRSVAGRDFVAERRDDVLVAS